MEYELVIIGGGPAACAAAVYAARKRLKTLLIAEEIGGQSSVSDTIYNWIGTPEISGTDLAKSLKSHIEYYAKPEQTLSLMLGKRVASIDKVGDLFTVTVAEEKITTKSVLVATGSSHRKLDVPGAADFEHKGIMYCATCDGPLFSDMPVVVVGGGNAALEAVLQLSQYANHVTLLHRSEQYRADQITVDNVAKLPNVTLMTNIEILEIKGDKFVSSVVFKSKDTSETTELPVSGIFIEIGQIPNTDFIKNVVPVDQQGKVLVDAMNQRTKQLGVWAAGDCTNGLYHQNNIAAGDAVKAIEDLYVWIKTGK
jgi:alkyl hydroperoxide reductase subunit F